jgi:pimeloyl-ACP methyl ester carboxylesterase
MMVGMSQQGQGQRRLLKVALVAGGVAAGTAVALAGTSLGRDELRRLRRMARPLGTRDASVPIPPPLPPGVVVNLRGRGEVFTRDTGGSHPRTVLLLHGWTVSADLNFFGLYGPLAQRYRVVAPDHRGHGRGMRAEAPFSLEDCADDAATLLMELGIPSAVVVGFSMGGAIGVRLAARHPQLVEGLVLSGTALQFHDNLRDRLLWRSMTLFEAGLRAGTGDGVVQRFVRDAIEECPDLEPFEGWITGESHRGYPTDFAGAGRALADYDGREAAAGISVPCAVVVTQRDHLVRPESQYELAAALQAPVFLVDGDHFAPLLRRTEFARAVVDAVDSVVGAEAPVS